MNRIVIPIILLFLWLIIGAYFGTGGIIKLENDNHLKKLIGSSDTVAIEYRGINFKNKLSMLSGSKVMNSNKFTPGLPAYRHFYPIL